MKRWIWIWRGWRGEGEYPTGRHKKIGKGRCVNKCSEGEVRYGVVSAVHSVRPCIVVTMKNDARGSSARRTRKCLALDECGCVRWRIVLGDMREPGDETVDK